MEQPKKEKVQQKELKSEKPLLLSLLSNLTIIGVLIYYLGWKYWEGFYGYFSIPISLVEISFEKIILTTWTNVFSLLFLIAVFWEDIFTTKTKEHAIGPTLFAIAVVLIYQINVEKYWWVTLSAAILLMVGMGYLRKRNFKYSTMSRTRFLIILGVTTYLFGMYSFRKSGKEAAENIYNNYEDNIEITITDKSLITGKFITYMNSKYFLILEDEKCMKHVVAIEESQTQKVKFLKSSETK